MLDTLRSNPPQEIGGLAVTGFEDLRDEAGRMGPFKGDTDRAARNFLIFRMAGANGLAAKVSLRPSGTEPKAKAYLEVSTRPRPAGTTDAAWAATTAAADAQVQRLATEFLATALATVGQTPTPGADKMSR
jgi:phosphoglucomutase/phosphomannomutase